MERAANMQRHGYEARYIVNDEHRFVYFVIQKAACTSIKTALLPFFDLDTAPFEVTRGDGTRFVRVHKLFNDSGHQIDKKEFFNKADHEYRDYFRFAFVRNPWDRLLSCYRDKVVNRGAEPLRVPAGVDAEFYAGMPFAEFVDVVRRIPEKKANAHFRSQHLTVCDPAGEPMADFVGRFENLAEDFDRAAEGIGVPGLKLPGHNRSDPGARDPRRYREFYDERLKNLVHARYERDVETFGYSF